MSHPALDELLACALEASHAAVGHAMAHLDRRGEVLQRFDHDVKLLLDLECQQKAEAVIHRRFPQHDVLGEEGSAPRAHGVRWIIDPIDGTVNFSHGLSYWCNSIAVQIDGETVAGVVQAPALGELFTATLEQPARLNGQPIHVTAQQQLAHALALTGIEKTFAEGSHALERLRAVALRVQKVRVLGAAALDLCQVAAGRADIFFEQGIYLWDVAAGDLIVRRAGGASAILERWSDTKMRYGCSNGLLQEELLALLQSAQ